MCLPPPASGEPAFHIRPIDARAKVILARAVDRSPLVRDLVARLAATNVIIHLGPSQQVPSSVLGTTRFGAHLAVGGAAEPRCRAVN